MELIDGITFIKIKLFFFFQSMEWNEIDWFACLLHKEKINLFFNYGVVGYVLWAQSNSILIPLPLIVYSHSSKDKRNKLKKKEGGGSSSL